jgi:lysophospholipase L1-like esterase
MGGQGSMEAWRGFAPPWANKDRVHLTQDGYRALAGAFVGDLLAAYDAWRATR